MKNGFRWASIIFITLLTIIVGAIVGSVNISLENIMGILGHKLFGSPLPETVAEINVSILWDIRLPQVWMAFLVGSSLAASGTVMQSVLRNPLASSYTLGVSSGASLFAALVIVTGFSIIGRYTLPVAGFIGGLLTVFLAMMLTMHFDKNLENQTIILVGMVLSLFVNGMLTLITALAKDHLARLIFWQMGSFGGQPWDNVVLLLIVSICCILVLLYYSKEMDLMTFGEEHAMSAGVELKTTKLILIALAALLTGTSVSMVGVIGFVDLIAPHVARKIFGSNHRAVIPSSAMVGGTLMVLADLISRTIIAPRQLPVGAVTALVGAPFFAYVYFSRRRKVL